MLRHAAAIALSLCACNLASAQQPWSAQPYWNGQQPSTYPAYPYQTVPTQTHNYWNNVAPGSCPGGVCPTTPTICGPDGCYPAPGQTYPAQPYQNQPYQTYPQTQTPRVRYPNTNQNGVFPFNLLPNPFQQTPRPAYNTTPVYTQPGSSYPGYPSVPNYQSNPHLLSDLDYGNAYGSDVKLH